MSAENNPILLIGPGNMGKALLKGLQRADSKNPVYIKTRSEASALEMRALFPSATVFHRYEQARILQNPIVIFAVKPVSAGAALAEMFDFIQQCVDPLLLSAAAGLTIQFFRAALPGNVQFIRMMPNTPCEVGAGFISAYCEPGIAPDMQRQVAFLLRGCGRVAFVDNENLIDSATALAGSGPAYVFHLVEALAQAGEAVGLSPDFACAAAKQTLIGAAKLLEALDETPEVLRKKVTSPNGTTQAGLEKLINQKLSVAEGKLTLLLTETLKAATERSRAIANETEQNAQG